jgi:hypothetical protein
MADEVVSFEDVLNFARQGVEDSKRIWAVWNCDRVEHYCKGNIQIVIGQWGSPIGGNNEQYDLIFAAVPPLWGDAYLAGRSGTLNLPLSKSNRGKHHVPICSGYSVECPEQVIPSFVWLERSQNRHNIGMKLSEPFFDNLFVKIGKTVFKGKGCFVAAPFSTRGKSTPRIIQSSPKIINRCQVINDRFGKLDLTQVISTRIFFDNSVIWFLIEETSNFSFKFENVLFCSADAGCIPAISRHSLSKEKDYASPCGI